MSNMKMKLSVEQVSVTLEKIKGPLPYRLRLVEDDTGITHTFDLSKKDLRHLIEGISQVV